MSHGGLCWTDLKRCAWAIAKLLRRRNVRRPVRGTAADDVARGLCRRRPGGNRRLLRLLGMAAPRQAPLVAASRPRLARALRLRSEEHTSELQSLMRISYAVFCLKKKN